MAGALWLYRFSDPFDGELETVSTFESADLDVIVTITEQKAAHRTRMEGWCQLHRG